MEKITNSAADGGLITRFHEELKNCNNKTDNPINEQVKEMNNHFSKYDNQILTDI